MIARASPRRRHGRRTLMCSSQPRDTPRLSFSLGPDPRLDDARDLVAVPGDHPQARVELVLGVRRAGSRPRSSSRWPQWSGNASGLRLEDRPVLVGGDRPHLEARRGAAASGTRREVGSAHQEEVADGLEAAARQRATGAPLRRRRRRPGRRSAVTAGVRAAALGGAAQVLRRSSAAPMPCPRASGTTCPPISNIEPVRPRTPARPGPRRPLDHRSRRSRRPAAGSMSGRRRPCRPRRLAAVGIHGMSSWTGWPPR